MPSVFYNDKEFEVKEGRLDLHDNGIKDIADIKGLESLTDLKELILFDNEITDIKGLENLINLEKRKILKCQLIPTYIPKTKEKNY